MRCQPATLRESALSRHPLSYILPSFSQNTSGLLLPKRLWKCESTISFWKCKWKVMLLLIYFINYNSSKSTFFMLNYGIWPSLEYSFCQINWNSSFLAIICVGNKSHDRGFAWNAGSHDPGFNVLKSTVDSNAHVLLNPCVIRWP